MQHGGGQRLGDAVDLINEEDAFFQAGGLHSGVDAGDDLAHGVFRHRDVFPVIMALADEGQAHRALAGVVGDGIGHQRHAALPRRLFHDLGLADARRAHQQDGALPDGRDGVFAQRILGQIRFDGVFDLFFGSFDVHKRSSHPQVLFSSRQGSSSSYSASARADAALADGPANSSSSSTTFMAQGGTLASSKRSPRNRNAVS